MNTSGLFKTHLTILPDRRIASLDVFDIGFKKMSMVRHLFDLVLFIALSLLPLGMAVGQEIREYKVYKKISPCSGRFDWISVAKENPVWGLSFHELANTACDRGCTYAEAMNVAENLRLSNDFYNYCCRDYSVWYKIRPDGIREYTVVLGKFGTPGPDYFLERGNLCCEEAENISGISTGCSVRGEINCPAGSYSAWNPQTRKSECFCYPGYNWNNTKTACISSTPNCEKSYANSVAIWDNKSNQYLCHCKQGYVWNATKTECIPAKPDCNAFYKNSVAVWDNASNQYLCNCPQGYEWNATRTECILAIPDCNTFYKNSVAVWDDATKQYLCNCPQGYVWNTAKTECILSTPDCNSFYKNSVAVWDDATRQYLCNCPQGYVWNTARTECILATPDCNAFYKNSIAVWDDATRQYLCNCPQGYVWNTARTECIVAIPDCNAYYKNSVAVWDDATRQYLCNCPQGYEWNTQKTECIAVSGNRDNPYVTPQQQKQGTCNIQYKSGANEPEQYTIDVKNNFGKLNFSYETYQVKDRIHIYYGGAKVFDSGCVGTSGSQTLSLNGSSSIFTIIVDPKCDADSSDTSWNFTLGCPTN